MKRNIRSMAVLCSATMLLFTGQCAHAGTVVEVINVNCGGHKWVPESTMNKRVNPTDRGVAPFAYRGSTWSDGFGWSRDRLKNSENKTTAVRFHVTQHTGEHPRSQYFDQNWKANKLAFLNGGWRKRSTPLVINGLDKFNRYDLYLPSQGNYGRDEGGSFSTGNVSDAGKKPLVSTGENLNGATWVEGEDYVVFRNIVPSEQGGIRINFTGILNGFQLVRIEPRKLTTTSLVQTAGENKSKFGDRLTFTATVAGAKPTGKVIFCDYDGKEVTPVSYYDSRYGNGAPVGTNDLPPLGAKTIGSAFKVSVKIEDLPWGRHSITAKYTGDMKNAPSSSAASILNVKPRPGNGKLKVFILSGQSNMEGHGNVDRGGNPETETRQPAIIGGVGSLRATIANNPDRYGHLLATKLEKGRGLVQFIPRSDVWMSYWNRLGKDPAGEVKNGPLATGFGASGGSIGPEYGFGQIIGDAMDDQVLIIKTAWGGKSLAGDFRPPSSGGKVGPYYSLMIEKVHKVLGDLKKHCPNYQGKGYEIVGFGWHQGWNDRIDKKRTDEYEANLVNLIKDVRAEFKAPKMRFVIATTGMSMANIDPTAVKLIAAQTAVSDPKRYPKFAGTVATVDTRPFDYGANSPTLGGSYHWNYNGESHFHIGEYMALAMMKLPANK